MLRCAVEMASRQLEETIITRPRPASPAEPTQHSGQQGSESGKGPSSFLDHSSIGQRKVSSIGCGPEKILSSGANFPTTHLATTPRTSSARSRSSNPPTHKLSPASYASPAESYFVPRPTSSGIEARSPAQKRPPASRSSHGIETSTGPPPALSTQRTKSTETIWKHPPAEDLRQVYPQFPPKTLASSDAVPGLGSGGHKGDGPVGHTTAPESSISGSEKVSSEDGQNSVNLKEEAILATKPRVQQQDLLVEGTRTPKPYARDIDLKKMSAQLDKVMRRNTGTDEVRSQPSQEDFFLNLAHTDSVPDGVTGRDERRRVGAHLSGIYMLCIRILLISLFMELGISDLLHTHHQRACNDIDTGLSNCFLATPANKLYNLYSLELLKQRTARPDPKEPIRRQTAGLNPVGQVMRGSNILRL